MTPFSFLIRCSVKGDDRICSLPLKGTSWQDQSIWPAGPSLTRTDLGRWVKAGGGRIWPPPPPTPRVTWSLQLQFPWLHLLSPWPLSNQALREGLAGSLILSYNWQDFLCKTTVFSEGQGFNGKESTSAHGISNLRTQWELRACTSACAWTRVCMSVRVSVLVNVCECMCVHVCVCVSVWVYVYESVCEYMGVCACVCTWVCVSVHVRMLWGRVKVGVEVRKSLLQPWNWNVFIH